MDGRSPIFYLFFKFAEIQGTQKDPMNVFTTVLERGDEKIDINA